MRVASRRAALESRSRRHALLGERGHADNAYRRPRHLMRLFLFSYTARIADATVVNAAGSPTQVILAEWSLHASARPVSLFQWHAVEPFTSQILAIALKMPSKFKKHFRMPSPNQARPSSIQRVIFGILHTWEYYFRQMIARQWHSSIHCTPLTSSIAYFLSMPSNVSPHFSDTCCHRHGLARAFSRMFSYNMFTGFLKAINIIFIVLPLPTFSSLTRWHDIAKYIMDIGYWLASFFHVSDGLFTVSVRAK